MAEVDSATAELVRARASEWLRLQNKAMVGLGLMVGETLVITGGTVLGLANEWFTEGFATVLVTATVTPSWAAYTFIVQRVFSKNASTRSSIGDVGGPSRND